MSQEILASTDSKTYQSRFKETIEEMFLSLDRIDAFLVLAKSEEWLSERKRLCICSSLAYLFVRVGEFKERSLETLEKLSGKTWKTYLKEAMDRAQSERPPEA